ncbi:MAG: DUF1499 domain-containing protein [Pseudomonadota bacterium]
MIWFLYLVGAVVVANIAFSLYVRLAPINGQDFHVDPLAAGVDGPRSAYHGPPDVPSYQASPEALFAAFREIALATPRTRLVAETEPDLSATFLTRSALMGFPDYTSVRVVPWEDGATVAIYARARFGYSDLGVNAARVAVWRAALDARFTSP